MVYLQLWALLLHQFLYTERNQLGICLEISPSELMKIRVNHREVDACKSEMLMTWLRQSSDVSWSAVVRALVEIRMGALAQKVALKYG